MGLCDYTGLGSSVTSLLCNSGTGNMSQSQIDDVKAQTAADITQASAGAQPAVIQNLIDQANSEIDKVVSTFSQPGEKPSDVGASPQQAALRVAGTGNVTLATLKDALPSLPDLTNLKYYIAGFVVLFLLVEFGAPIVARQIARK